MQNKRHLPIYVAAEDIKCGQVVCIDSDGNVRGSTNEPVHKKPFPTLEELRKYATLPVGN